MKKLIAMIGAAAMAFGLFADATPTPFATSFEAADGVTEATYTPGEGWTWQGDPITVGVYAGDKYVYGANAFARRNGSFLDNANDQYLKLETGTNALSRAVSGNVFLDQLVKFTGFEEYQTNVVAGTKIAVWMSGIEQEGTATWVPEVPGTEAETNELGEVITPATDPVPGHFEYSDDYIAGETNLYVTVGKIDGDGKVTPVAIKIAGNYKLDTWYRLTIKSLGSIFQYFAPRAGFIIYVDGQQVKGADAEAKSLIVNTDDLTLEAAGYMADGALFPAIDTTDATFATVGYQGIGAIDDIILDTDGPEFARTVNVRADQLFISGAKIVKVTQDGEIVTGDGVWKVKAGNIVVWYAPDGAYVFKGDGDATATWSVTGDGATIVSGSQTFEVAEAAAKITRGGVDSYYAADELDATIALVQDGDKVTFLKQANLQTNLYVIPANTTIDVAEGGVWTVNVPAKGRMTNAYGAEADKNITVTLGDSASLTLSGTIYSGVETVTTLAVDGGRGILVNGALAVGAVKDGAETDTGAVLKAAAINLTGTVKITLAGKGKVITKSKLTAANFANKAEELDISEADEGGYITYSVAQSADPVAKIGGVEYTSLQAAFDAAQAGETVELIDNLTITDGVTLENKDFTFNLGGFTLTSDGAAAVISMTNSVVVITNGIINGISGTNYGIENTGESHITFASDAVITGSSPYMFYPRGAVVDVYGTITQLDNQYTPCIWASVEGCIINIYDGANLSTPGGDIIRHRCNMPEPSNNAAVVNIYGGTFSGGDIIYGYASSGSVNNGKVNIYGGTFTVDKVYKVLASANLTIRPFDGECSTLKFSKLATGLAEACAAGYAPVQGTDGWYTIKQVWDVTFYVGDVVSNAQVVVNGECAKEFAYDTETIEAWTNAAGKAFAFTTPITEATTLYAQLKAAGPVIPVDDDEPLNQTGTANATAAAKAITEAGGDVNIWVATVYGEGGKIPASKLNATTAANIALAVANDLPITINEPTFEVKASEATEGNVAAFEFTLKDGATPVEIKAATDKVKAMVKYTDDLATAFDTATDTEVDVGVANGKIKAQLVKQNGVNAGFMKVEPKPAPTK